MHRVAGRWIWRAGLLLSLILLIGLSWRAWDSTRGPELMLWHTHVPEELRSDAIQALNWAGYLQAEQQMFDALSATLDRELPDSARTIGNRYYRGSPMYPQRAQQDWNRSYLLQPDGPARGVVVLLHGLTDSPYSLRHLAQHYRTRGFVAVGIRLPGHGTVPGALTRVHWQDWRAATRLAVDTGRAHVGAELPLHLVGYSNGAALAMQYAVDALGDESLHRAERIVLLSPMIGVTSLARFADVLGWPALFPAFARAAWIDVLPEYNPYKYNSFPVNGARQSSLLSRQVQAGVIGAAASGRLQQLPPLLAFQSVVDATVSTSAVVSALFQQLPENGSELVLIDIDRSAHIEALLHGDALAVPEQLLPSPPRRFHVSVLSNRDQSDGGLVEWRSPAGSHTAQPRALGLRYPFGVYSLSHVALPFPLGDGLYGLQPDDTHDRGLQLGALSVRGERGMLRVAAADLTRMSSNPFFEDMLQRIDAGLPAASNHATNQ